MARIYQLRKHGPTRLRINYDGDLNPEQRAVVEAGDGPLLVIAGAGSGKTRALTYRVGRLIETGTPPAAILLLTFTNKAAREMLTRVADLVGAEARLVCGGTFHHVANLLLRDHAARIGFGDNYTIIDREDARDVMAASVAAAGIDHRTRRFPKPEVLLNIVSASVNTQRSIAEVVARVAPYFMPLSDAILRVARTYVERKHAMNAMDFDDLLVHWWALLEEDPDVARQWQERFRHVLVDEYQDTNALQGLIVDRMVARHGNVTVVGDDCQSIYSFRGADFENILRFPQRYPETQIYHLTLNYRSTPEILALANASIAHNVNRFDKVLRAVRATGHRPAVVACRDVYQQAEFVAQRVLELRDEDVSLEEIAILYRAHHHSMEIQVELQRRGIPFRVRSGLRFFEQAHIKDVLSYLRFVYNPLDELAFKRAVKLHDGIGNAVAEQLFGALRQAAEDRQALLRPGVLAALGADVNARARRGYAQFVDVIAVLATAEMQAAPGEMIATVAERGYRDLLRRQFANADQRIEDIDQLSSYADTFDGLEALLTELALVSSFGAEETVSADAQDEKLTLSSVHQAKGLEWGRVFVVWLVDGRFPVQPALREPQGEEEERRLFYVATTRAKEELYLCFPMVHRGRDRSQVLLERSRFLAELPQPDRGEELFEPWTLAEHHGPQLEAGGAQVLAFLAPGQGGDAPEG